MRIISLALLIVFSVTGNAQDPGTMNTAFGVDGQLTVQHSDNVVDAIQLCNGDFRVLSQTTSCGSKLTAYHADLQRDSTWGIDGECLLPLKGMKILEDKYGRFIIHGWRCPAFSNGNGMLTAVLANGSIDSSYADMGSTPTSLSYIYAASMYSGKVVCASHSLYRLDENGALDSTFAINGQLLEPPDNSTIFNYGYTFDQVWHLPDGRLLTWTNRVTTYNVPSSPLFLSYFRVHSPNADSAITLEFLPSIGNTFFAQGGETTILTNGVFIYSYRMPDTNPQTFKARTIEDLSEVPVFELLDMHVNAVGSPRFIGETDVNASGQIILPARFNYVIGKLYRTKRDSLSLDPTWNSDPFTSDQSFLTKTICQKDGTVQLMTWANDSLKLRSYFDIPDPRKQLSLNVVLGGSFDPNDDLMNNVLMQQQLVPSFDPYDGSTAIDTSPYSCQRTLIDTADVVDWVRVALLSATDPSNVIVEISGLLKRDGSVTDVDGTSPLPVIAPDGVYLVKVMHRNHLSIVSATPITFNSAVVSADFANGTTPAYGTDAQKIMNGKYMLWEGDVNGDGIIRFTGSDNDRDPILTAIGGTVPTNVIHGQYRSEDVNMDGVIKYTGQNNDRDPILLNVGGATPTNTISEQLP